MPINGCCQMCTKEKLTFQKFCCGFPLEKGAWVAAVYTTFWSVMSVIGTLITAVQQGDKAGWLGLLISVIFVLVSASLFVAIKQKKAAFMSVWVVVQLLLLFLNSIIYLILSVAYLEIFSALFGVLIYLFQFYLILIVRSYAIELKSGPPPPPSSGPNNGSKQGTLPVV